MGRVVFQIATSLDGFITGPNDGPGQGLGEGGEVLHEWYFSGDTPSIMGEPFKLSKESAAVFDESLLSAGASVVGRRMYDIAKGWGGSPPGDVPTFVVTHEPPDDGSTGFTYVDGVESAIEQAKAAAGEKGVIIGGGASIGQQALSAGMLDEMLLHVAPVLLGDGRRLFENLPPGQVGLEVVDVVDAPGVTHLRYRVLR